MLLLSQLSFLRDGFSLPPVHSPSLRIARIGLWLGRCMYPRRHQSQLCTFSQHVWFASFSLFRISIFLDAMVRLQGQKENIGSADRPRHEHVLNPRAMHSDAHEFMP